MRAYHNGLSRAALSLLCCVFLLNWGCSTSPFSGSSKYSTKASQTSNSGSAPIYYDFKDVLIPSEMKVDRKSSFIYYTTGFTAGVLALKGRVDLNSLITFFDRNMQRDGWQPVSSFRSPRTIMLFHKDTRWCVISILEKEFRTYAEIWVAPTLSGESEEGLLKPQTLE